MGLLDSLVRRGKHSDLYWSAVVIPWQTVQGFSGATAVGSIAFVGWALITNAFADNLFPVIDLYSSTPTWAIVVAVPIIALTYLLGLLFIGAGEILLLRLKVLTSADLDDDGLHRNDLPAVLTARFQVLRQEAEVLAGSALAIGMLAIGTTLHAWRIDGWRRFLFSVTLCAIVLAIGSAALAVRRHRAAAQLLRRFDSSPQVQAVYVAPNDN
jgi:hypothetical protein